MPDASPTPVRDLIDLRDRLRLFADARDWNQFHSPKNLAMALVAEAAEVVEHFQWLTDVESTQLAAQKRSEVAAELADVLAYLVRLADRLDIDLLAAAAAKLERNEQRYPVELARGSARKYTEL